MRITASMLRRHVCAGADMAWADAHELRSHRHSHYFGLLQYPTDIRPFSVTIPPLPCSMAG